MTNFDGREYFRLIAQESRFMNLAGMGRTNFHTASSFSKIEQFLKNGYDVGFMNLIYIDSPEGRMEDNNSDNIQDREVHQFIIARKVQVNNFVDRSNGMKECKYAYLKIVGKMKRDKMNYKNGLRDLDINSFSYFSVGPLADYFWGIAVTFSVNKFADLSYNKIEWNSDF